MLSDDRAVAASPDGKVVLINEYVRPFSEEKVAEFHQSDVWIKVATGMELSAASDVQFLAPAEWEKLRAELVVPEPAR